MSPTKRSTASAGTARRTRSRSARRSGAPETRAPCGPPARSPARPAAACTQPMLNCAGELGLDHARWRGRRSRPPSQSPMPAKSEQRDEDARHRGPGHVPDVREQIGARHRRREVGRVGQRRHLVAEVRAGNDGARREPEVAGPARWRCRSAPRPPCRRSSTNCRWRARRRRRSRTRRRRTTAGAGHPARSRSSWAPCRRGSSCR